MMLIKSGKAVWSRYLFICPSLSVPHSSLQESYAEEQTWKFNNSLAIQLAEIITCSFELGVQSIFLSNIDNILQWTNFISGEVHQIRKKTKNNRISLKCNIYSSLMYLELLLIFL